MKRNQSNTPWFLLHVAILTLTVEVTLWKTELVSTADTAARTTSSSSSVSTTVITPTCSILVSPSPINGKTAARVTPSDPTVLTGADSTTTIPPQQPLTRRHDEDIYKQDNVYEDNTKLIKEEVDIFHAVPMISVRGNPTQHKYFAVRVPLMPLRNGFHPSGYHYHRQQKLKKAKQDLHLHNQQDLLDNPIAEAAGGNSTAAINETESDAQLHNHSDAGSHVSTTISSTGSSSSTPFSDKVIQPYHRVHEEHPPAASASSWTPLLWATPVIPSEYMITVPANTTRICVDVGTFIHSPTSRRWFATDPNTFVLAVEANPFSASLIGRIGRPSFVNHIADAWPPIPSPPQEAQGTHPVEPAATTVLVDSSPNSTANSTTHPPPASESTSLQNCAPEEVRHTIGFTWSHIGNNAKQILMFPMAGGTFRGAVGFQLGFPGRPDGGSMLEFRKAYAAGKAKPSRVISVAAPLKDILQFVPAAHPTPEDEQQGTKKEDDEIGVGQRHVPFLPRRAILWDTLKIDAQGMDGAVLAGAGPYIRQFACVVGEFDNRGYTGAFKVDHVSYLIMQGFAKVSPMVFANRRLTASMGAAFCSASDVKVSLGRILKALTKADRKFGKWTEKNEKMLQEMDANELQG